MVARLPADGPRLILERSLMVRSLVLPSLSAVLATSLSSHAADLDTLDLARKAVTATIPLQWEDDDRLGSYLFARGGVNLLNDPKVETATFTVGANKGLDGTGLPPDFDTPFVRGVLRDLELDAGVGYDIEIGLGLKVAEDITIELATGVQWNPISSTSGRLDYHSTEPDGQGGTNDVLWTSNAVGGEGEIWQVPITVSLLYDAEIADDLRLTAGIGAGVQWSNLSADDLRSDLYPGAIVQDDLGNDVVVPLTFQLDGEAIALRYQAMVALSYELFPGGFLGGYLRYAGTSAVDLGRLGFVRSPNNLYREGAEIEVGYLRNLSIGATFTISF